MTEPKANWQRLSKEAEAKYTKVYQSRCRAFQAEIGTERWLVGRSHAGLTFGSIWQDDGSFRTLTDDEAAKALDAIEREQREAIARENLREAGIRDEHSLGSLKEEAFRRSLAAEAGSGIRFFLSLDLANATEFKTKGLNWPSAFATFYRLCRKAASQRLAADPWKYIGDEVLFVGSLTSPDDVDSCVRNAEACVVAINEELDDLPDALDAPLRARGTLWIARTSSMNLQSKYHTDLLGRPPATPNLAIQIPRPPAGLETDYLGPDIDAGFRLCKHSYPGILAVSADTAWLLRRLKAPCVGGLRVVAYEILKGVWDNRPYPVVWYCSDWDALRETVAYDEQHASVALAAALNADGTSIQELDKIYRDIFRDGFMEDTERTLRASHEAEIRHKELISQLTAPTP